MGDHAELFALTSILQAYGRCLKGEDLEEYCEILEEVIFKDSRFIACLKEQNVNFMKLGELSSDNKAKLIKMVEKKLQSEKVASLGFGVK